MDEVDLILGTVAHPDHRAPNLLPGREHFYRRRRARVGCDRSSPAKSSASLEAMTIIIAGIPFDHHHYDERGDVLYLNVGQPRQLVV